jgi:hypothetical protein
MTRKLGLLALALCLIGAVAAAAVQAKAIEGEEFEEEGGRKVVLTGKQVTKNTFKVTTGSIQCGTVTYTGTGQLAITKLKLTPAFSECTCFGFSCTADVNGCAFEVWISGKSADEHTMDVVCPEGKELTFTAVSAGTAKCTIHYPSQLNGSVITSKNLGMGNTREVELLLKVGLAYFHTKGTGLGACTEGLGIGTLEGSILLTAERDKAGGAQVGIWIA